MPIAWALTMSSVRLDEVNMSTVLTSPPAARIASAT